MRSMQKSLLVMPSSSHSGRVEQTDEKLAGETGHVCVLTSGANIAEYGRTNSACVPFCLQSLEICGPPLPLVIIEKLAIL